MTMTLQQISDRIEIHDLLVAYGYAMEGHDWDALDDVFTDDAIIDYSALHGTTGDVATTKAFMQALGDEPRQQQYLVASSKVTITGDEATARTIGRHPCMVRRPDGTRQVFFCGIWYNDRFVRTSAGWRIRHRQVERFYYFNLPPELSFLADEHTDDCACAVMTAS